MLLSLHLTQNYVINGREKTMRLIDVDELKKRSTKVMFRDAPECGEFDAVAVDDIDCMQTIDPESLRPTAHWISTKDEFPTLYTGTLFYGVLAPYGIYSQFVGAYDGRQWFADGKIIQGVTHWMPLPKPPEEPHD